MLRRLIFVIAVLLLWSPAYAGDPPASPILEIETGKHIADINRVATDSAGRFLATASDDRTLRVWNAATGELLSTIRPPVADVDEGKLYAVAMSPDGTQIACGGMTGFTWDAKGCVYLFDRQTGQMLRRLPAGPHVAIEIAWSQDGRFLAFLLSSGGLRVVRTSDWKLVGTDTDYGGPAYGASFAASASDGSVKLATSSYDGNLRVYAVTDTALRLLAAKPVGGGQKLTMCAITPDGSRIAVGFREGVRVAVCSGDDLSVLYSPSVEGLKGVGTATIAASRDGTELYAAGKIFSDETAPKTAVRCWKDFGKGAYRDLPAAAYPVNDVAPLPDHSLAAVSYDASIVRFDANGARVYEINAAAADYPDVTIPLRVAADGSQVAFSYDRHGTNPATFTPSARAITAGAPTAEIAPPVVSAPGYTIPAWTNAGDVSVNGVKLEFQPYELSRSLAIDRNNDRLLLGTSFYLRCYSRSGELKWFTSAPSDAWSVNVTLNGSLGVAAFGDGTIRWYRMSDGKELLAFFPNADRKRWVAWTPSGYYECSVGGEDLIGWQLNHSAVQAADFFSASRFRAQFYRPDVIAKLLTTLDEAEAVRIADSERGRKVENTDVATQVPPVVTILSPGSGDSVSGDSVTLRYSVRTPSGEPATAVRVLIDGRPVTTATRRIQLVSTDGQSDTVTVVIPHADCRVSLIAENRYATSEAASVQLKWGGAAPAGQAFVIKPKLYVLAIGVSKYADPDIQLDFPAKDARDFAAIVSAQKGGLYRDVITKVLTDGDATKDNIEDGLDWIQRETTSKDVAMIFLSGHGANDSNGAYLFIPQNFSLEHVKSTGVPFSDIKNTVAAIAGKALFFVDSCHSGNVMGTGRTRGLPDVNAVVNELSSAENGAVVFTASTGTQLAQEDTRWGNGAFTKAVVEGLSGKADFNHNGRITVNMLDLYVSERVKELTRGAQTPTTTKPPSIPDFPIAVVP